MVWLVVKRWYPGIFLETSGVWRALRMVVVVDLGPLLTLTLILIRPHKPGLRFDRGVLAGDPAAQAQWSA